MCAQNVHKVKQGAIMHTRWHIFHRAQGCQQSGNFCCCTKLSLCFCHTDHQVSCTTAKGSLMQERRFCICINTDAKRNPTTSSPHEAYRWVCYPYGAALGCCENVFGGVGQGSDQVGEGGGSLGGGARNGQDRLQFEDRCRRASPESQRLAIPGRPTQGDLASHWWASQPKLTAQHSSGAQSCCGPWMASTVSAADEPLVSIHTIMPYKHKSVVTWYVLLLLIAGCHTACTKTSETMAGKMDATPSWPQQSWVGACYSIRAKGAPAPARRTRSSKREC